MTYTIVDIKNSNLIWENDISLETLYEKLSKVNVYYGHIRTIFGDIPLRDFVDLYGLDKTRISLFYIHEHSQTYESCLAAVKRDGEELYFVQNQTDDICLEAVKQDAHAICYVKKKTANLCRFAIQQDPPGLYTYRHKLEEIIKKEE